MSLPKLSIARPVAVTMFFLAVVVLGALSFSRLAVDLLPDIAYPKLVVYTTNAEVAPAEIERFITEPIEQAVSRVPGVERLESVSRQGASLVTLHFAWGTNMDFAALNVRERVDGLRGTLPLRATRPTVLRTDPRSEPIMALSVAADGNVRALQELTESVFRRRLEQIDGVAQALVTGGLEREIQVDVDPARSESYHVTIDQIAAALAAANAASPTGTIRRGRFRYSLRTLGELQSEQIGDIVIAQGAGSGRPAGRVLLRDIATVRDGFRDRESIARYNGREAVGLLVFKESGANTVRVAEQVNDVLDELRGDYGQVAIDVATSQAVFVADAIANLVRNMIAGAVLAFVVLVLFLRDPRYPIAIALAIPLSVMATFALFHAFGVSLNIMSLGGLALGVGMLADNSIVVIENIYRHREKGVLPALAAAAGTQEVQRAITASTLTTIAVFGPIVYVEGVAGELFAALSFAVAFSLLASLLVACTLLPTMAARWRGAGNLQARPAGPLAKVCGAPLRAFDQLWARTAIAYEHALAAALRHRARVVLAALVLLAVTAPVAFTLPRSMLPDIDQGEFRARLELPRGTPLDETAAVAAELERLIRSDEAVAAVFTRIGRQAPVVGMDEGRRGRNTALLDVRLRPGEGTHAVLGRLRPQLAASRAWAVSFESGQATALGRLLGAGEADLAVRVRGEDIDGAMAYASAVARSLARLPEVTNVRVGTELGEPEYVLEVDRERAATYGVAPSEVVNAIEASMRGRLATQLVAFDHRVPIMVRLPEADRQSLATLQLLRVGAVPIRELVRVRESVGPVEIQRLDGSRVVRVYADAAGRDIDTAARAIRATIAAAPPPATLRVEVGGENEELRRSFRELGFAFVLALLLVYMILAAEFESLIHPFTVLLSVPLGVIGAIVALRLFGAGLNTVSLIGIVILIGIVDNDAVIKIDVINQLRREGLGTRAAIMEAGRQRLRPVVMNTMTTMLAIAPLMLGIGAGAGLQAPLAIAVFGGLFTATILTLLVIPVVYELIDELRLALAARRPAAAEPLVHAALATERIGGKA